MLLPSRPAQWCCDWTGSHFPTCITKHTKTGTYSQRVFVQYLSHAGKKQYKHSRLCSQAPSPLWCTWEHKTLASTQTHTHSQQADWAHIVVIGGKRIPPQGVCACDRPGLGRWRRGIEVALGRENREQRNTQRSTLRVLNRIQTHSNPAHPESSIRGDSVANYKMYLNRRNNTVHQMRAAAHLLMCQFIYRFGFSIKWPSQVLRAQSDVLKLLVCPI